MDDRLLLDWHYVCPVFQELWLKLPVHFLYTWKEWYEGIYVKTNRDEPH